MQQQQQPPSQPRPAFNTAPTFAPKPQPSLYSVTPILNQHAEEEEPDVIRYAYFILLFEVRFAEKTVDNGERNNKKKLGLEMNRPRPVVRRRSLKLRVLLTDSTKTMLGKKRRISEKTSTLWFICFTCSLLTTRRDQEEEYLASLTEKLSAGTTWERICELIELQNSQSKTIGRTGPGTSELGRFKEVLLRLKRQGDAAPGAAGY